MNQPTVDIKPAQKERLLNSSAKAISILYSLMLIPLCGWAGWAGKSYPELAGTPGLLVGFLMGVLFVVIATAALRFAELTKIVGDSRWTQFWSIACCVTFIASIASLKLVDHYSVDMTRLVYTVGIYVVITAIIMTALLARLRRANRIINGEIKGPPDTKNLTDDDLSGKPQGLLSPNARGVLLIGAFVVVPRQFYEGWIGEFEPELTGWHGSLVAGFGALFFVVCGFCLLRIIEIHRGSNRWIWLWVACSMLIFFVSMKVVTLYFFGVARTYALFVHLAITAAILLAVFLVQLKRVNRDSEGNS